MAPGSTSYPVLAAADAAALPYGLALAYVEALRARSSALRLTAFDRMCQIAAPEVAAGCCVALGAAAAKGLISGAAP